MEKRNTNTLVGILALILTFGIVLTSFGLRSVYEVNSPVKVQVEVGEIKPSYDYLTSITVELFGTGTSDEEEYMCTDDSLGTIKDFEAVGWGGTGVVIKYDSGYTYILTNAHVAGENKDDGSIHVKDGNKQKLTEVYAMHGVLDMAVLKVKGKIKGKVPVKGFSVAEPQDKVYMVGHHLGRPYIYGEGVFAGYDELWALIQIPTLYGNSGSGVIDEDGNLIALVFGVTMVNWFQIDDTHAVAIDGESVKMYLEKLNLL